jgi:flavin reductase (DIM6/NTAB) family NADH-FMN oxidoreductase RutF
MSIDGWAWEFARGVSEFDKAGLHTLPSLLVKAPRCAESPIHFECRFVDAITFRRRRRRHHHHHHGSCSCC